jgi:hypothetical protein
MPLMHRAVHVIRLQTGITVKMLFRYSQFQSVVFSAMEIAKSANAQP